MNILTRIREFWQRRAAGRDPVWDDVPELAPTRTMPAVAYQPHGIDSQETLAAIVAKAQADAEAAQQSALTEAWAEWDQPGTGLAGKPAIEAPPPPPMPFSGVSSAWVASITPPDVTDLSYDKDRRYREYLRHIGAATGTSTALEVTGTWPRLALEPGDGTGVRL